MAPGPRGDRADPRAQRLDRGYAKRTGATWVDYTPALATAAGGMKPGMAMDGVHPTEQGYAVMEGVLAPVVRRFDVV